MFNKYLEDIIIEYRKKKCNCNNKTALNKIFFKTTIYKIIYPISKTQKIYKIINTCLILRK